MNELEDMKKKLDASEKAMAELQAKADAAQAKVDAFEADFLKKKKDAEDKEKLDSEKEEDPKEAKMDAADFVAAYNDRKSTEDLATRLSVKYDEKSSTQDIKKAVIKARLGENFRRVDSATEIDAAFEVVVQLTPAANSPKHLADSFRRADASGATPSTADTVLDFYDTQR